MATKSTYRGIRLPKSRQLVLYLDFRFGEARDLVSQSHLTINGTGDSFVYSRRHQALSLTSAGSGYIDTNVDTTASGTVIALVRDKAGAGVESPILSDGFGATDEAMSLIQTTNNAVEGQIFRSGGSISFLHSTPRLSEFNVVGFSWGNPGKTVEKIRNLNGGAPVAWDFVLDTTKGDGLHLNVRSDGGASQFGNNEFGFLGMWNTPLHVAEMRQVARQLLSECVL